MSRFESVLVAQQVDPRVRNRMILAALAAAAVTSFAGAASWTAEHMKIHRVDAPRYDYAILFDVGEMPPPPSVAPPPRPAAAAATQQVPEQDDDVEPEPDRDPVDVDLDVDPVPRPKAVVGERTVPGVPGNTGTGPSAGPPCMVPPCLGTGSSPIGTPFSTAPPVPRPTTDPKPDKVIEKINVVRANALYSPDPDRSKLARTNAGTMNRRSGKSAVSFCVSAAGKAVDVRTSSKFGDDDVDRICRETVQQWRFRPFEVGGKARKTCSTVTFDIRFD